MLQIIKIEEANYKKYCNLDIVAFSYAKAGACGDGGSVCIIDINGQIYYTNYADLHAKLKYKLQTKNWKVQGTFRLVAEF